MFQPISEGAIEQHRLECPLPSQKDWSELAEKECSSTWALFRWDAVEANQLHWAP